VPCTEAYQDHPEVNVIARFFTSQGNVAEKKTRTGFAEFSLRFHPVHRCLMMRHDNSRVTAHAFRRWHLHSGKLKNIEV